MSNYTKTTNFAAKDSLPSGNAGKIVKGTEIDAEFNNIATASATKADINGATLTGTTTFGSLNDGTITITGWVDEDNMSSNSAVLVPTQQSVKAYVDSTTTAQDLDVTDGSSSIDIDLDSESLGILGGTGVTSTASGTGVTLAIDSTVATLTGTQTLTNKTLTTPTILTSFTIGSATISEAELEILDGATVTTAELNVLDGITSTTAELNILDGVTSTAAEINILDGVTSTTAELNKLDGFTGVVADLNYAKDLNATGVTASEFDILDGLTATTAELNILDGVTSTTAELNILDGVTSTTAELNILDGVTSTAAELNILDGVTSTTAELNILDGVTSTATELNLLDGVTATTAELNYTDGVTSAIQTQLDSKISGADAALTGNATITTSDNTTQLALISTDADANAGPILDLFRNSVSAADNDLTGQVYFSGKNDADEKTYYGQITSQITDVSNGSEDFALELSTLTAGASNSRLFISPTETVFNESSADLDFRIESDGNTNAFFLEGSSGNVGIGISPNASADLHVADTSDSRIWIEATNGDTMELYAGTNVSLFNRSNNALTFGTNNTERMRLTAAGALQLLDVNSPNDINTAIYSNSDVLEFEAFGTNGAIAFSTGSGVDERMRIDTSGNVGIGMTPSAWHANWTALQLGATGFVGQYQAGATDITALGSNVFSDGAYKYIETDEAVIYKQQDGEHIFDVAASGSANAAISWTTALTIKNSGNVGIGTSSPALSSGWNTVLHVKSAALGAELRLADSDSGGTGDVGLAVGQYGNNSYIINKDGGTINFWAGANGGTERMRIRSDGGVGVNTSALTNSGTRLAVWAESGSVSMETRCKANVSYFPLANYSSGGSYIGGINATTTATSLATSSDQRLKENIADADDAGSKVDAIQVRQFDWIANNSHQDYGMVAQELRKVIPDVIHESPDADKMLSVDYAGLVPMLVKEIQSLRARVAQLENN